MLGYPLRNALSTVSRYARQHLGQADNADALERRLTRDDLAHWLVDADGFGPATWDELRGGIDTAFAVAAKYNIPQLHQAATNALRAFESANVLVEEAIATKRMAVPPAANRNASSHLSVVVPRDESVFVVIDAPTQRGGTIPAPPKEVA